MSKLDTGGPARPSNVGNGDGEMTWLDEAAMRIAATLVGASYCQDLTNDEIATCSYDMARALLAEKRRLEGGGE